MSDVLDPKHEALIDHLFERVCNVLGMQDFVLKPLRRRARGRGKLRMVRLGYTRLNEKSITVDLYTPRTMRPRKLDAILRVICHELAHHQTPPMIWRRWFARPMRVIHHPAFWLQYKKNVEELKKDLVLAEFF